MIDSEVLTDSPKTVHARDRLECFCIHGTNPITENVACENSELSFDGCHNFPVLRALVPCPIGDKDIGVWAKSSNLLCPNVQNLKLAILSRKTPQSRARINVLQRSDLLGFG